MTFASAFNKEKALLGAFSVIVKTGCENDGLFYTTDSGDTPPATSDTVASTPVLR